MNAQMDLARQWVGKAKNDLLNADNNLRSENVPFDTVCFHCQQAAEKLLKAYMVARGTQPPTTHDVMWLLEEILAVCPDADVLRDDLALLMPYAVEIRYPDDRFVPTPDEARQARQAAGHVLEWLQCHCMDLF